MRIAYTLIPALCLGAISVWLIAGPAHAVAPSPETGAEIAARWCADCHVISQTGESQTGEGVSKGPGFSEVADTHSHDQIVGALSSPHARPMKGFTLSAREVADLAAYIDSLKEQTAEKDHQ